MICGSDRPRIRPSVTVAKSNATTITTSGSERNRTAVPSDDFSGTSCPLTAVSSSSTAGRSAVTMLMNAPGNCSSGRGFAVNPANGFALMWESVLANTGPARISAGTEMIRP